MAYTASSLYKAGGANPAIWIYTTADATGTGSGQTGESGYFNDATTELKQNDVIMVVASTGGTRTVDVHVVSSASGAATVTTIIGT